MVDLNDPFSIGFDNYLKNQVGVAYEWRYPVYDDIVRNMTKDDILYDLEHIRWTLWNDCILWC